MIGIISHLCWEIESYRKPGRSLRKQIMVAFVGFLCSTKSGILTHCPQARAVHAWMNATCKGKFAWIAQLSVSVEMCQVFFCGQGRYFNTRAGCKVWFTFDGSF